MARLLAEEQDPRHLAANLARLTTTLVRASQAQRAAAGDDGSVRLALLRALGEIGLGEVAGSGSTDTGADGLAAAGHDDGPDAGWDDPADEAEGGEDGW